MAAAAERRAAQRRLARQVKTGTYQPSTIGRQARQAAAIGSSNRTDIRADLEERALRRAVKHFEENPAVSTHKFDKVGTELRIKGGVIIHHRTGTEEIPLARLEHGQIILEEGWVVSPGSDATKIVQIKGMSNAQFVTPYT